MFGQLQYRAGWSQAGATSTSETAAETAGSAFDNNYSPSGAVYDPGVYIEYLTLSVGEIEVTGNDFDNVITGNTEDNHLYGMAGEDTLSGGGGNDTLNGGADRDVLSGGSAADILVWSSADTLKGGSGTDTIQVSGADNVVDLRSVPAVQVQDMEVVNLTGTGDNTLCVNVQEVLDISSTSDTLRVRGDAGDVVHRGSGWTQGEDQQIGQSLYATYTQGDATLLVDTDILCVI